MHSSHEDILVGRSTIKTESLPTNGSFVQMAGETFYRIAHSDQIPPFFISVVSSADHWLFIASTGGLTAGRINPESALFPYDTEDKVSAQHELTGSKMIMRVTQAGRVHLWEPFSDRYAGLYSIERHLYKNIYGNKLIFEEVNHDLALTVRYAWRTGDRFGFVKSGWLHNDGSAACQIDLLDGIQNIVPYGVTAALQRNNSGLLNGYKRNELEPATGMGIFALSATLTDRPEPSESLKATVAWQVGLAVDCHLLSTQQVDAFRTGRALSPELDVLGKAGAYFVASHFTLDPAGQQQWHIVADVNQDRVALSRLTQMLHQPAATVMAALEADIAQGTADLVRYVAAADGLQQSAQEATVVHHFANVLFNIMRGGIFADGYHVHSHDLIEFVRTRNRPVLAAHAAWFADLPAVLDIRALYAHAAQSDDPDLIRLCHEYLPLTFSRRHGDPSRPWNSFSINLKKADGSQNLDYQGNWRDIFQNWEPLALSYPAYTEGMIAKFLNATTADGYNPYRVTRDGIEWELVEPDNPWSNIGYWNDHQIIYLQKLLEIAAQTQPGRIARLWNTPVFAYADVPYRLRSYQAMLQDWYNTIDFDWQAEATTAAAVEQIGTDGRLLRDAGGAVVHVTMVEKLLVLLLTKLTNLVPGGGIWMNTQRPEWNDANNALVGKGLSVVTTGYLRRFIAFWQDQLAQHADGQTFTVNAALFELFSAVQTIFDAQRAQLARGFSPGARRTIMDALGMAAQTYRTAVYAAGIPAESSVLTADALRAFLTLAQEYIEQTLQANRRPDGLGHTYNILRLEPDGVEVDNLYLMLEGQVGYLSSGLLSPDEALALLQHLRASDLYRADQHSYMLYPNRALPRFLEKNNVAAGQVADSRLVAALMAADDARLLTRDAAGTYHFNGRFRNVKDVAAVLDTLAHEAAYADLVENERAYFFELFESVFNHRAFTGRSGTFFAYEGLGSIYWHMVSKLLLAAQESTMQAVAAGAADATIAALEAAYYDIRAGMGFNKGPAEYGAFPTDPYSHTPIGRGAQQPGMTGLVKEEILTRWGELGVVFAEGRLHFAPTLLRDEEFLQAEMPFVYLSVAGDFRRLLLAPGSLAFTFCQVPVIYQRAATAQIDVVYHDGRSLTVPGGRLDAATTQHVMNRDGHVQRLHVALPT